MLLKNIIEFFRNLSPSLITGGGWGVGLFLLISCARMGAPDGGWYDETPPRVVSCSPDDRGINVTAKRVYINFNEYIKLDNAQEKVVISPPQQEQPVIKVQGKRISIELLDSLKPNTTYTIDFSDAISDNNEGNPMGNYTYSFSTGETIDTLAVSGTVLNAEDLEPIKGILVGLYQESDTMMRVARTDSRGNFIIRGVAPGKYTVGALQDVDGDYRFTQRAEKMAFSHETYSPSSFLDYRQDTIWADNVHIKDILRVPYTHFLPDNIVLRAFDHKNTARYYTKFERLEPDRFTLFFSAALTEDSINAALNRMSFEEKLDMPDASELRLPMLSMLEPQPSSDGNDWVVVPSQWSGRGAGADTITYWLRNQSLIDTDTIRIRMTTLTTDTLGMLRPYVDTLTILPKTPYEKRLKAKQKAEQEWAETVAKKKKKLKEGQQLAASDTIRPPKKLDVKFNAPASIKPDENITISFPAPMQRIDTTAIHLYVEQDSLWFRAPITFEYPESGNNGLPGLSGISGISGPSGLSGLSENTEHPGDAAPLSTLPSLSLYTDWIPGAQYSFEVDSAAFVDMYGIASEAYKTGLTVSNLDNFSSLFVNVTYNNKVNEGGNIIVQLIGPGDKILANAPVENGTAEFYYLKPGSYFMRAFIDSNGNGIWDTGDYYMDQQPEEVYYYPTAIECKAKWDITKAWNLTELPLDRQKPEQLKKQKGEAAKKILNRNAQRAADMGIEPPKQ